MTNMTKTKVLALMGTAMILLPALWQVWLWTTHPSLETFMPGDAFISQIESLKKHQPLTVSNITNEESRDTRHLEDAMLHGIAAPVAASVCGLCDFNKLEVAHFLSCPEQIARLVDECGFGIYATKLGDDKYLKPVNVFVSFVLDPRHARASLSAIPLSILTLLPCYHMHRTRKIQLVEIGTLDRRITRAAVTTLLSMAKEDTRIVHLRIASIKVTRW